MERAGVKTLAYGVRPRVIAKYLGQLCAILAMLNLMPLVVALGYGEYQAGLSYLGAAAVLGLLAISVVRLPTPTNLQTNEALVITALAFLVGAAALVYPFMDAGLTLSDAIFEAVSGVTTTGLTTLGDVESKSHTFLFARAWIQWYSGLGIVILSLALLIGPGVAARRLAAAGGDPDDITGTSRLYARRVMVIYVVLTVLFMIIVAGFSDGLFNASLHVLTGISTAGYSSFNESLGALGGPMTQTLVLLGCVAGAIPFALYYQGWHGDWGRLIKDREVQLLVMAIVLVTLALYGSLLAGGRYSGIEALGQAAAIATSAQTTTGFSTLDVAGLEDSAKGILILSMASGGALGSTAGGIKIIRLLILFKLLHLLVLRTAMPSRAVVKTRLNGQPLEMDEIQCTLLIILLYILLIAFGWLPFLVYGYPPLDALFEVVSAAGTVGLSAGITAADLEPLLKGVLCVIMLLGRVEVLAFLVLFAPGTWFGKRN